MSQDPDLLVQIAELQELQTLITDWIGEVDQASPFPDDVLPSTEECQKRLASGVPLIPGQARPSKVATHLAATGLEALLRNVIPGRATELEEIFRAAGGADGADHVLEMVLGNRGNQLLQFARQRELAPDLLTFHAVLLARPFRAWFASRLRHFVTHDTWQHGHCPICGHWPSLGLLDGQEDGRRYVWCLQCGVHWRLPRLRCAFCGNENQNKLTVHQIEGENSLRLQCCQICLRYLKEFRSTDGKDRIPWDAVHLGTAGMDQAAADLGFLRESPLISHHEREAPPQGALRDAGAAGSMLH